MNAKDIIIGKCGLCGGPVHAGMRKRLDDAYHGGHPFMHPEDNLAVFVLRLLAAERRKAAKRAHVALDTDLITDETVRAIAQNEVWNAILGGDK